MNILILIVVCLSAGIIWLVLTSMKEVKLTKKSDNEIISGFTLEETLSSLIKDVKNHGQIVLTSAKQFPWLMDEVLTDLKFHFSTMKLIRPEEHDSGGVNLYQFSKITPKGMIDTYLAVYYNVESVEDYELDEEFPHHTNKSHINVAHKVIFIYPESSLDGNIKLEWFKEAMSDNVITPRLSAHLNTHFELGPDGLEEIPNVGINISDDLAELSYYLNIKTARISTPIHPVRLLQRVLQHAGGVVKPVSFLLGKEYRNGKTFFLKWVLSFLEGSPSINIIRLTPDNIQYLERNKHLLIKNYANKPVINIFYAERIDELAQKNLGLLCDLMEGTLQQMLNSMCIFPYNDLSEKELKALSGPGRAVHIEFNTLTHKQAQKLISFLLKTEEYGTDSILYEDFVKNPQETFSLGEVYSFLQKKVSTDVDSWLNSFTGEEPHLEMDNDIPPVMV